MRSGRRARLTLASASREIGSHTNFPRANCYQTNSTLMDLALDPRPKQPNGQIIRLDSSMTGRAGRDDFKLLPYIPHMVWNALMFDHVDLRDHHRPGWARRLNWVGRSCVKENSTLASAHQSCPVCRISWSLGKTPPRTLSPAPSEVTSDVFSKPTFPRQANRGTHYIDGAHRFFQDAPMAARRDTSYFSISLRHLRLNSRRLPFP